MKHTFNRMISRALKSSVFERIVALVERYDDDERPNLLRVLTYHRVACDTAATLSSRLAIPPDVFEEQMRYLASEYHVVALSDVLEAYADKHSLPPRSVLITFDDGYRDFAEQAWPILKQFDLPVTVFVPTAFPDNPGGIFWWDRLYHGVMHTSRHNVYVASVGRLPLGSPVLRERAYTRLRAYIKSLPHRDALPAVDRICRELRVEPPPPYILGWDELRRLAADGVTLGAHTRTHPLMNRISLEEAHAEIVGSYRDLVREIGSVVPVFAYPGGAVNRGVRELLVREGFKLAFTTVRGINVLDEADRLRLRRINVGRRTNLPLLRAQLMPAAVHLNRYYDRENMTGETSSAGTNVTSKTRIRRRGGVS